jgi:hypothetical protein
MVFNWQNIETYNKPFKYGICDNFLEEYSDDLFPDDKWCENTLSGRENDVTRALSAIIILEEYEFAERLEMAFYKNLLSSEFHDKVCEILEIPLIGEKTNVRKTIGDYRIAREAMVVENTYCEENILDVHHDNEVTIWSGSLYFSDSKDGSFNIHNEDKSLHKTIPIKKNRLILTRNSSTTFHSVSPWLSKDTNRKSYYITSEFKNFGRNNDRSPIDATELWINT